MDEIRTCTTICKDSKIPTGKRIIIVLIVIFVLYIILQFVTIRVQYKSTFDWWKTYTGSAYNKENINYDEKFNLFYMLAAYHSKLLYEISSLNVKPAQGMTQQQQSFIFGDIMSYATYNDNDGTPHGCVTPRSLCESIKPELNTGDAIFDDWYNNNFTVVRNNKPLVLNLEKDKDEKDDAFWGRISVSVDDQLNEGSDVYPSDSDTQSWMQLIIYWLGGKWSATTVKDGDSSFNIPASKTGTLLDAGGWYNYENIEDMNTSHPANFFARMGIGPQSPILIYFCNGTYSVNGMRVDANAFQNLLNSHGPYAGGWVGFVKGMGNNISFDEYTNYVRSRVDYQLIPPPPPKCKKSTGGGFAGFFSAALPMAAMALFIPPPVGWGAAAAITVTALAVGTIGAVNGAGCTK
uniref:Transmembrane protein n=1 Tax=viral metagenome TaxID=1070528 RepID=A0A6C0LVV0_9ZZZZ